MPPRLILHPSRYRHLVYGMAKATAVLEEGAPDGLGPPRPSRRERELQARGGVVLPTPATPAGQ